MWHTQSWVKSSSLGLPGVVRCLTPVPMWLCFFLVCWIAFKVGCPCFVHFFCAFLFLPFSSFVDLRSWWCALCVCQLVVYA